MPPRQSASLQITIAVIGLIGVIATAMFTNWDKIFPHPQAALQPEKKDPGQNPPARPGGPEGAVTKRKARGVVGQRPVTTGSSRVALWFQTADQSGKKIYWPNNRRYRGSHLAQLSDDETLYFEGCDVLPRSQQGNCDLTSNWIKVNMQEIHCTAVQSCTTEQYKVSDALKDHVQSELTWSAPTEQQALTSEAQKPTTESNEVRLYFQTESAGQTFYYPNSASNRTKLLNSVSDDDTLYFAGCDLLSTGKKAQCGSSDNWKMLSPQSVGCASVKTCTQEKYVVPADLKTFVLAHLKTSSGEPLSR
jgi:hypothetical protein